MEEQTNKNEQQIVEKDDEKMAVKFPDWDLLPPDLLIKRQLNEK